MLCYHWLLSIHMCVQCIFVFPSISHLGVLDRGYHWTGRYFPGITALAALDISTGPAHFSDCRTSSGQYILSFTGPYGPPRYMSGHHISNSAGPNDDKSQYVFFARAPVSQNDQWWRQKVTRPMQQPLYGEFPTANHKTTNDGDKRRLDQCSNPSTENFLRPITKRPMMATKGDSTNAATPLRRISYGQSQNDQWWRQKVTRPMQQPLYGEFPTANHKTTNDGDKRWLDQCSNPSTENFLRPFTKRPMMATKGDSTNAATPLRRISYGQSQNDQWWRQKVTRSMQQPLYGEFPTANHKTTNDGDKRWLDQCSNPSTENFLRPITKRPMMATKGDSTNAATPLRRISYGQSQNDQWWRQKVTRPMQQPLYGEFPTPNHKTTNDGDKRWLDQCSNPSTENFLRPITKRPMMATKGDSTNAATPLRRISYGQSQNDQWWRQKATRPMQQPLYGEFPTANHKTTNDGDKRWLDQCSNPSTENFLRPITKRPMMATKGDSTNAATPLRRIAHGQSQNDQWWRQKATRPMQQPLYGEFPTANHKTTNDGDKRRLDQCSIVRALKHKQPMTVFDRDSRATLPCVFVSNYRPYFVRLPPVACSC